ARITPEMLRGWRLDVDGPRPFSLTLAELGGLPQSRAELPITCVEGWSASALWEGVRLGELLERAGAPSGAAVRVVSLQQGGAFRTSVIGPGHARDPLTLLALRINGEVLNADHGYPARVISANRPGVLQTKWVTRLEVLA
ncbi:molybdopterin-dependent oxidoreductase, partial [Streptomyces sparsus]